MSAREQHGTTATRYDFDRLIDRQGTDSVKWSRYGDALPLWVADMDFPSAEPIVDAIRRRVEHGVYGYGVDSDELRAVVQARLQRLYDWRVEPQDLLFIPTVIVGFNLIFRAVGAAGDGVIFQTPAYPPFFVAAQNAERSLARAPLVPTARGYEIDFDAFEAAITRRTRVFLLCNPHNPTGRVFTRSEVERLAEICVRHDLIICADEIHQDFVFEGHRHWPMANVGPEVAQRTVTLLSPSKTFNTAGFHFAIAHIGNPKLRAQAEAAGAGLLHRPGVLDIVTGLASYRDGQEWFEQLLPYLQANRDFLVRFVREHLPGVTMAEPAGTYLAWLDCRGTGIEGNPANFFLKKAKVALMDGAAFGADGEGFVRLNFGCPRQTLQEGLDRMKVALLRR